MAANIRRLSSGRYQVRFAFGGARVKGPHTFKTKADANAWLDDARTKLRRGTFVDPASGSVVFRDFANTWLSGMDHLAERTSELYGQLLDSHILPTFGHLRLSDITPAKVKSWRTALPAKIVAREQTKAHPRQDVTGKTASAKAYRLLSEIMKSAVEDGLIPASPCKVMNGGKEEAAEGEVIPLPELATLISEIPERQRAALLLATWCQLRRGEFLALRRSSVDLDVGTLSVRVSRPKLASGQMIEKSPKTPAGKRVIAIPPHIIGYLQDHLERFVGPEPDAYLLTGAKGKPLHPGTFYKNWDRARKVIGRPTLTPHDLRHTGLTLYAQTGATTAELMHRAGHDSPTAALRYQHATIERDRAGADSLSELARNWHAPPSGSHSEGRGDTRNTPDLGVGGGT